VVQRAVLMATGELVTPADLGLHDRAETAGSIDEMSLDEVERYLIKKALERAGGNVAEAAKGLGLSRSAMYRRLQKHGM
jgi:transcriptional regulator of acetoin/glycerol metabolism